MSRARTNKENRPKRPSTLGLLLGGTGGRKDASKGAEAERQRRRRERDRSREMAAYVGYDAMYRDGIAQVMPGVFSQTVEFSDISYQSARKEARETAFTVMSSLFNYFPADSHVQLQVVNAPIPADEVGRRVQQVTSVAQGCTIGLEPLHFRQRQALNSVLPLGDNHVTVSRYLTTGQVAMQMPFASQSLDEAGGGYYGQSKESGNLVLCDRKRLASPMGFVCGKPGSGKSFSVKREITNTVLAHPEDEVVIFDPAGEYGNLVGALGGANVELAPGCSAVLNPLDTADVADRADAAKLAYKTDAVLALSSALMAEGREGLPERDRSIIARCVGEAYRECARDGRLPTLGDFHAALLAQPEPEAADIALRYERYVKGAFSFFNGQSNVALDNRITNIDMHGLGQNMRVFGMITALEMVRNRVMVTPPRPNYTWLYIDEVQSLFAHPTVVEYFARLWREGRKFGLICTGISQNTSHMLANAEARDMVLNSEFFLLHKQSTADLDAWAEMLQLSATERGYIGDAVKPGEGLLISAGIRVPITDDFPKGPLYDLWNTKPAEVAEREMRRAAREAEE